MAMQHEEALPREFRIEEYEFVQYLDKGGFGITYLGWDHNLDRKVAIKEYLPNEIATRRNDFIVVPKTNEDQKIFEWGMNKFMKEATTLARFDEHRSIPDIFRILQVNGTAYMFMEFIDGKSLFDVFKERGKLAESSLREILMPLLDGLEKVHNSGFFHMDIKPKNIMIRAHNNSPVLIDFGAARQELSVHSASEILSVTHGFAPVEQYSAGGNYGAWTDLYSLAAVSYQGLTGEIPLDALTRMRNGVLKPLADFEEMDVSHQFMNAIEWGLQVNEADRPQSINEWRLTLHESKDEGVRTESPPPTADSSVRNWRSKIVYGLSAVVLIVVGVLILYEQKPSETQDPPVISFPDPSPVAAAWERAVELDTPQSYRKILEEFPDSDYTIRAKEKLEALHDDYWKEFAGASDIDSHEGYLKYKEFLEIYENSRFGFLAEIRIKAWEERQEINN